MCYNRRPLTKNVKKDKPAGNTAKNFDRFVLGYNLAIKFTAMLACPILGGLGCGIWLDRQLQTTPWLMFILVMIGLVFSVYAVYRVASREANINPK